VRTTALLKYGISAGLPLVESNSSFGAADRSETRFVVPLFGHLGIEYDAAAFVIGVYRMRRFCIAAPVAHARV
jgi:hypothetical protein